MFAGAAQVTSSLCRQDMLSLCRGHRPCRIEMSSTSKYYPEHLINMAEQYMRINQQITLEVGRYHFPLNSSEELALAANIVAFYHNQYVTVNPDDDNWYREPEEPEGASQEAQS